MNHRRMGRAAAMQVSPFIQCKDVPNLGVVLDFHDLRIPAEGLSFSI